MKAKPAKAAPAKAEESDDDDDDDDGRRADRIALLTVFSFSKTGLFHLMYMYRLIIWIRLFRLNNSNLHTTFTF